MCPALRQDATRQSEGQLENRPTAGLREADIQIDEGVLGEGMQRNLYGSHVVESVVQLLADGFVLQFLSVQLVF